MKHMLPRAGLLAMLTFCLPIRAGEANLDVARDDVQRFVRLMVQQHGFSAAELTGLLRAAQPQTRILELMRRPAERTLAWWEYRARFLTNERIAAGVQVWQTHRDELERVSMRTGVPAQYLVAITGVETLYGRVTGRHRVLDALVTLGFDYPPRGAYFRGELTQFLLMAREEGLDARTPLGSYAGAMGIAQFMPSSVRRYAVDAGSDGKRDMWQYGPDVFASIANYFVVHGWRAGQPVLADASHDAAPDDPAALKVTLAETIATLRSRGYRFDSTLPETAPAMLIPAKLAEGMSWRIGYQNFYVITRYNRSMLYAMAVHDLAQAIAASYQEASRVAQEP